MGTRKLTSEIARQIDAVIERNVFRKTVHNYVPKGASRLLDVGCNEGELLLRLRRDKGCSEIYGVEIKEESGLRFLDKYWLLNLEDEGTELGLEYHSFFHYIICHDVLEHTVDPWHFLIQLRKYLSPDGQLIVIVPNAQFCVIIENLLRGFFSYDLGPMLNSEHLRWFCLKDLLETVLLTGYSVKYYFLQFPKGIDFKKMTPGKLELPTPEFRETGEAYSTVESSILPGRMGILYSAIKVGVACTVHGLPRFSGRIEVGKLSQLRLDAASEMQALTENMYDRLAKVEASMKGGKQDAKAVK